MKKKLLSLIAVSAALATAGSALIACGDGDKGNAKTDVTKEQWVAAFAIDNFASDFKVSAVSTMVNGTESQEMSIVVGTKQYGDFIMTHTLKRDGKTMQEESQMRIVGEENDRYYKCSGRFDEDENKFIVGDWHYQDDEHEEFTAATWEERVLDEIGFEYMTVFAEKYDSFNYVNGAYVMTGDGIVIYENSDSGEGYSYSSKMTATNATIKFADNKLASVEISMKYEHSYDYGDGDAGQSTEESDTVITITYGGQSVTAPDNATKYEDEEE
ncbi:MAG: hypothetical protein K2I75_00435 [Clostridiales bacterium]|nr:hypothetical protein [Clostridiales bacterium]